MIRLKYRGWYGDRPFVYKSLTCKRWTVIDPVRERENDSSDDYFADCATFDEAIHEADRLARVRAKRDEQPQGEYPPIAAVQALIQAAWA